MQLTIVSLIAAALAGLTSALPPLTNGTYFELGPLPYDELRAQVDALHGAAESKKKRDDSHIEKRTTEGVYLCDGLNFSGNCYYGAYPIGLCIYPDSYWVTRLQSAGPDNYNSDGGGSNYCIFNGGSCCECGNVDVLYSYPGGNLPVGVADGMGAFFCD